jgi:hypothetical protein
VVGRYNVICAGNDVSNASWPAEGEGDGGGGCQREPPGWGQQLVGDVEV